MKTAQSKFLLRPSRSVNEIIVGVIGRGLREYPAVHLYAIAVLSNHVQGLASATDGESLSAFLGYFKSNVARKLNRLLRRTDAFWGRRTRFIPVLDEEAQVARLSYILSQGVKEGLVRRPELWPGVHCARSLMTGEPLHGTWFDQTRQWYARRAGEPVGPRDFATPMEVSFNALPCWAVLPAEERQRRARELVEAIVRANAIPGRQFLGVAAILAQDPEDRPAIIEKSPAPPCHASSLERWQRYKDFLRELVSIYESVSARFRRGLAVLEEFPAFCFPPKMPFRSSGRAILFEGVGATA